MRIECPNRCGVMLEIELKPQPEATLYVGGDAGMIPTEAQQLQRIRDEADRRVGAAVNTAVVNHVIERCTGPGVDAIRAYSAGKFGGVYPVTDEQLTQAAAADDVVDAVIYCGSVSPMGYECSLVDGHADDHQHRVPETMDPHVERVIATWPA